MKHKNNAILTKMAESIALTFVMLLFTASAALAQSVVTGRVTDSKKNTGVAGVTVTVKGTGTSTQTGADGTFKLSVPAGAKTLSFTSIGYSTQDAAIGGPVVNASLVENAQQLVDVVVVAYGTRKKTDLTGAVTQISAKDFQKGNNNSPEQLLQGKVAGVQITSGGGSAGGGSRIRIRGGASLNSSNDPLIVIDGVPVESNGVAGNGNLLNMINPNDIESMTVLKDASATALYGSRASNGVLIVTSKKGTKGRIKFSFGSQLNVGKVNKTVEVLTATELRSIIEDEANKTGTFTWRDALGTSNTDWQKLIYQDATGWDNSFSMSGALGGVLPFRLSGGYLNQSGIIKTDKFERYTGALNLSPTLFDNHLSVNLNLKLSQVKSRFADGGAVGAAASFDPTQAQNAANKYGGNFEWLRDPDPVNGVVIPIGTNGGSSQPNPLSLLEFRDNRSVVNRFIGNLNLDYKLHFLPDLHILVNWGRDYSFGKGDDIYDTSLVTQVRSRIANGQTEITGLGGFGHYAEIKTNDLIETSLFYAKEFKSFKFDVLAGHTFQDFTTNNFNYNFLTSSGAVVGAVRQNATDKPQNRIESYLGRTNITILDKYLLTASIRRDATSKFSKANRVGYFPAVALAWKLKEEFFKSSTKISELKLRFGWGETGQQDGIGRYEYLPRYSMSNQAAQYQFGSQFYQFLRPSAYDPNLKWETTATSNIGLDFGFFNNRISGSFELYKRKTKNLLSSVPAPAGSNFDIQIVTNVGNVNSEGFEFTLNTTPVKRGKFQWDFGFNVTYNKAEVVNLLKYPDPNFKGVPVSNISGGTGNNIGLNAIGYAPNTFYMYKQIYDEQTGMPIEGLYEDINRDGIINEADRYLGDKPGPDVLFGINTQFNFGPLYLGIAAHGMLGNSVYNNYASNAGVFRAAQNPLLFTSNISRDYLNTRFNNNQYLSDYYISNGSFFRLDNINIGYNVGKVMKNNRTNLRINASIQNVLVITKYKGLDPEIASDSQVDNNIYPRPRVYSLGFNLDF